LNESQLKIGRCAGCCITHLIGVLVLSGCATYSDSFGVVERNLATGNYEAALSVVEKQSDSRTGHVLFLLNKGMILRMKRDFAASNESFEAAKIEMERLYAASISENALSFVVNDATVSYVGDAHEQVLVHLYMALNYLELGQINEARVEALQVDIKLREIGEKVPDSKYTEDAMSRYLSGLIYEELEEWDDAMIAYRKSYEAYKSYQADFGLEMPDMLKHDLVRVAQRLGLTGEADQYSKEFGIDAEVNEPVPDRQGELIFVLNNGLAPIKRERAVSTSGPPPSVAVEAATHKQARIAQPVIVNIAIPYYESRSGKALNARVSAVGKQSTTQIMEDIDAIARASLDARMPAITARSVARAIAKGAIQESVDRAGSRDSDPAIELLGSFFIRVASIVTERADTRSWLTLPANLQLARLALPPGSYVVTVELLGEEKRVISTREYQNVVIKERRKTYLTEHWISN